MGVEHKSSKVVEKRRALFDTHALADGSRVEAEIVIVDFDGEEKMAIVMTLYHLVTGELIGNDLLLRALNAAETDGSGKVDVIATLDKDAKLLNLMGGKRTKIRELLNTGKLERIIYVGDQNGPFFRVISAVVWAITYGQLEFIAFDTMEEAWERVSTRKKPKSNA